MSKLTIIFITALTLAMSASSAEAKRYCAYKTGNFPTGSVTATNVACGTAAKLLDTQSGTIFDGHAELRKQPDYPFSQWRCAFANKNHSGIYHMACHRGKRYVTADLYLVSHGTRICTVNPDSNGYLRQTCKHYSQPWKVKVLGVYKVPKNTDDAPVDEAPVQHTYPDVYWQQGEHVVSGTVPGCDPVSEVSCDLYVYDVTTTVDDRATADAVAEGVRKGYYWSSDRIRNAIISYPGGQVVVPPTTISGAPG